MPHQFVFTTQALHLFLSFASHFLHFLFNMILSLNIVPFHLKFIRTKNKKFIKIRNEIFFLVIGQFWATYTLAQYRHVLAYCELLCACYINNSDFSCQNWWLFDDANMQKWFTIIIYTKLLWFWMISRKSYIILKIITINWFDCCRRIPWDQSYELMMD